MPALDKALVSTQTRAALDQFVELVREVREPATAAVGHWTVRDVATHVAGVLELYGRIARGGGSSITTIDGAREFNDHTVPRGGDRDIRALADRVEANGAALLAVTDTIHGDPVVPWHAGLPMPVSSLLALMIGEFMMHGYDIAPSARSLHQPREQRDAGVPRRRADAGNGPALRGVPYRIETGIVGPHLGAVASA